MDTIIRTALFLVPLLCTVKSVCKTEPLTVQEQAILNIHNEFRAKHQETGDLCYAESDDDVTFTSQSWADEQAERYLYQHSIGGVFAENLHIIWYPTPDTVEPGWVERAYRESATSWYLEIKDWDFGTSAPIPDDTGKTPVTGHFKAMVWKGTKQLNCGYTLKGVNGWVVCQYYPSWSVNQAQTVANVRPLKSEHVTTRWRDDRRCGASFILPDGTGTECNPDGDNPCCYTNTGWCGRYSSYCDCAGCIDFRKVQEWRDAGSPEQRWRFDKRCGSEVPLADGSPSECDPDAERSCCTSSGYCVEGDNWQCGKNSIDYKKVKEWEETGVLTRWREDGKCGRAYILPNGEPTECDPDSVNPCCRDTLGYERCGGGSRYCNCGDKCTDYRL